MSLAEEKKLDDAYVMPTFGRFGVEFVGGRGMTLVDDQGKEYLDFLAGIGVCSLGHCHPVLVGALEEQAEKLVHVSNYFYIEHRGSVAKRLSDLAGQGATTWKTFFANSGAEANECAMKLARLRSTRSGKGGTTIVALRRGFHGRTLETVAATMQERLQKDFRPLPPGFVATEPNDVAALERLFAEQGDAICAVMLEPIQGESGVHPLTDEFMGAVRRLCDEHDALMIADEVQCGMFRTGRPFAFQLSGATPDIFTLAKGIAGGVPMGACVARADVADVFRPGDHGSTFGGSNLACAAADAVIA
ncbi:MAG: aminotransferase class III-fold pyridoxal phosphate-dependent enzyme, partial [Atopobiaceae bacterium]